MKHMMKVLLLSAGFLLSQNIIPVTYKPERCAGPGLKNCLKRLQQQIDMLNANSTMADFARVEGYIAKSGLKISPRTNDYSGLNTKKMRELKKGLRAPVIPAKAGDAPAPSEEFSNLPNSPLKRKLIQISNELKDVSGSTDLDDKLSSLESTDAKIQEAKEYIKTKKADKALQDEAARLQAIIKQQQAERSAAVAKTAPSKQISKMPAQPPFYESEKALFGEYRISESTQGDKRQAVAPSAIVLAPEAKKTITAEQVSAAINNALVLLGLSNTPKITPTFTNKQFRDIVVREGLRQSKLTPAQEQRLSQLEAARSALNTVAKDQNQATIDTTRRLTITQKGAAELAATIAEQERSVGFLEEGETDDSEPFSQETEETIKEGPFQEYTQAQDPSQEPGDQVQVNTAPTGASGKFGQKQTPMEQMQANARKKELEEAQQQLQQSQTRLDEDEQRMQERVKNITRPDEAEQRMQKRIKNIKETSLAEQVAALSDKDQKGQKALQENYQKEQQRLLQEQRDKTAEARELALAIRERNEAWDMVDTMEQEKRNKEAIEQQRKQAREKQDFIDTMKRTQITRQLEQNKIKQQSGQR